MFLIAYSNVSVVIVLSWENLGGALIYCVMTWKNPRRGYKRDHLHGVTKRDTRKNTTGPRGIPEA